MIDRENIETWALILFTARHRSRRQAKRLLYEAGMAGTAEDLDRVLATIAEHPQRDEIEGQVETLRAAALEAERADAEPPDLGGNHPEWLIAEDATSDRTFATYLGHDCAFVAEIFEDRDEAGEGYVAPLDEGQALGNVLWLDEPPPAERQAALWLECRRVLRVYDKRIGL